MKVGILRSSSDESRRRAGTLNILCYPGILSCLDGYMNIALEQTEEHVNGRVTNRYGDAFIRGNNGGYICPIWLWIVPDVLSQYSISPLQNHCNIAFFHLNAINGLRRSCRRVDRPAQHLWGAGSLSGNNPSAATSEDGGVPTWDMGRRKFDQGSDDCCSCS